MLLTTDSLEKADAMHKCLLCLEILIVYYSFWESTRQSISSEANLYKYWKNQFQFN